MVVALPLRRMMEFVSWDDDIPIHSQYMESHKMPWFQTTNQIGIMNDNLVGGFNPSEKY